MSVGCAMGGSSQLKNEKKSHTAVSQQALFIVLQIVKWPWWRSATYGAVHNKEPAKFDKSRTYARLRASFCRDVAMIVQRATCGCRHTLTQIQILTNITYQVHVCICEALT